jgi:hypothetical protein
MIVMMMITPECLTYYHLSHSSEILWQSYIVIIFRLIHEYMSHQKTRQTKEEEKAAVKSINVSKIA